jgi:hypothetical protein
LRQLDDAAVALDVACREILGVPAGEVPLAQFEAWKAGVQRAARQKLDRSLHRRSDGVEYFALYTELELSRGLEDLAESDSFLDGALCSETVQSVQQLTMEMLKERASKERKLVELGKNVFGPEYVERRNSLEQVQVLQDARLQLAEGTIQQMQNDLEAQLHSLERYKLRVSKEADSAKMRASLRKKDGEVRKQIVATVGRYNCLLSLDISPTERQHADAESLLAGDDPPWVFEGCADSGVGVRVSVHRTVEFKKQLELLDAYNRLRRLEEEETLLNVEKGNYVSYYTDLIASLDSRIAEAREKIESSARARPHAEAYLEDTAASSGRYVVPASLLWSDREASSGFVAALLAARFEATRLLNLGRRVFCQEANASGSVGDSDDIYSEVEVEELQSEPGGGPNLQSPESDNEVNPLKIWLSANNLDAHLPHDVVEGLTLSDIRSMTNTDLEQLGMPLGPRLRFSDAAKRLS